MTYNDCCRRIMASQKANAYAKAYAQAGIGMEGHEARVQALYILNNITHWRGEDSKEVRTALKKFTEEKK